MGPLPKPGALGSPVGGDKGSPSWDLVGLGVVRVFKKNGNSWEFSGIQFLLPGSCWFARYIVRYSYCE